MGSSILFRRPRTFAFILFITVFIVYLGYIDKDWKETYILKLVNTKLSLIVGKTQKTIIKKEKNRGLILDTPGCKIMKLDPFDPSVIDLYKETKPYNCKGPPLFMSPQPGGSISLNVTVLDVYYHLKPSDIFCVYQTIHRNYEKSGDVRENSIGYSEFELLTFNEPINKDYIVVTCDLGGKENFTQYFPLVHLKKEVEEIKTKVLQPFPRLNVLLAGVDSISKLNYMRHFRKTERFFKSRGNFFEMNGYVKVGDNTFPNLTPMLTGQHVERIWNETVRDSMFFDDVDIIWKKYSERGYRTFYAEDSPYFGLFNYGRRGFNVTPTDYYMRPLYLAIHTSELRKKGDFYCFNSQPEPYLMYDYLMNFVQTMGPRPYFAFAMTSALTHDYLNYAGYADYTTVDLLEKLWETDAPNNTVIIVFGDHGLRFGKIRNTYLGKYEERMPFLYIHFPTWFLEQYPHIHHHLKDNTERLVTLFDIYATLVHLLDPTHSPTLERKAQISPYGLSLMDEISPYRTCEKAGIFIHWCTCQVFEYVSPADREIQKSVLAINDYLQNKIKACDQMCALTSVEEVTEAKLGQLNDMVLRFIKHAGIVNERSVWYGERTVKYEDFLVKLTSKPCGDTFESTVRHNILDDSYDVVDINNISFDNDRHKCVDDDELQPFCCCK